MDSCGGYRMIFEDVEGNVWLPEEVDELSAWQIDDLGIHVSEYAAF